jgi:hypothetical protein
MRKNQLLAVISAALLVSSSTLHGQTTTVWTDTFNGTMNQRTVDGNGAVNSFEWYTAGTAWSYNTAGGGSFATTADRGALGYFTAPGQSATLVNPGDSITVTLQMRYIASGSNTGDRFRLGLFQSVANPNAVNGTGFTPDGTPNTQARVTGNYDNSGSNIVASNFVNYYEGYTVDRLTAKTSAGIVAANNVAFWERVGGETANSIIGDQNTGPGASAGFAHIGTGGNEFEIVAQTIGATSYTNWVQLPLTLTYTITYQGTDSLTGNHTLDFAYSLTDGSSFTNYYTYTGYEGDGTLSFDTIALYSRSAYPTIDSITITLTAIPEPSTYAALFGALALGFVAWRRRQGTKIAA